jgi:hypothetical protein
MKYFFAFVFSFSIVASHAQLDIRLNLDDALKKKTALNFELGADKFSIELGNRFLLGPWAVTSETDANGNAVGDPVTIKRFAYIGTLRTNFYTSPKSSLDGFHISPTLDYMRQNVQFADPTINNRFGASILFGYKYIIKESRLAIQAETGLGYWFVDRTKLKSTGLKPEGEAILEEVGLDFLKKFRSIRAPFNITINYRIGES